MIINVQVTTTKSGFWGAFPLSQHNLTPLLTSCHSGQCCLTCVLVSVGITLKDGGKSSSNCSVKGEGTKRWKGFLLLHREEEISVEEGDLGNCVKEPLHYTPILLGCNDKLY